jgi:hypothetical protein
MRMSTRFVLMQVRQRLARGSEAAVVGLLGSKTLKRRLCAALSWPVQPYPKQTDRMVAV